VLKRPPSLVYWRTIANRSKLPFYGHARRATFVFIVIFLLLQSANAALGFLTPCLAFVAVNQRIAQVPQRLVVNRWRRAFGAELRGEVRGKIERKEVPGG